jgi:hypothetical protein
MSGEAALARAAFQKALAHGADATTAAEIRRLLGNSSNPSTR